MAKIICYLLVLVLCLCGKYVLSATLLCENGFCRNYRSETGCATPRGECSINNATHTGLWMLSPTVCNCCQFCLPFIGAGDHCSVGGPGLGTTVGRCGDGLICRSQGDGSNICQRMETPCHTAQDSFDARNLRGETGALEERPECDGKGKYAPFTCVPTQSCFCQSAEGERIFGEILYTGPSVRERMHCGCSRLHDQISKQINPGVPYPVVGPRCTSDGNFHPIQCLDRVCYCVNPVTGLIQDGANRMVDLDVQPIKRLECSLDPFPEQSHGSSPYNYTTPCLESRRERIQLMQESEEAGFNVDFHSSVPACLPDWTAARTALTRNMTKVCVDGWGQRIGDYETFPNTPEFYTMDCKCAYTSHVIMATELERPVCCSNGSYRRVQCRRGLCRCVDQDGRQTERDHADVTQLSCYTDDWRTC